MHIKCISMVIYTYESWISRSWILEFWRGYASLLNRNYNFNWIPPSSDHEAKCSPREESWRTSPLPPHSSISRSPSSPGCTDTQNVTNCNCEEIAVCNFTNRGSFERSRRQFLYLYITSKYTRYRRNTDEIKNVYSISNLAVPTAKPLNRWATV